MGLGQGAAEDGKILGEDIDQPPVDRAPASDDTVAGNFLALHAEFRAAMLHEHVEFLEGAFIEEQIEAFPRSELAARVLGIDALLSAAGPRIGAPFFKLFQDFLHGPSFHPIR
jgi:hypothetical protein